MRAASILLLFALAAWGQAPATNVERVLQFRTEDAQSIQEIGTAIRTVADIRQATVDAPGRTLKLSGTTAQIALAEWLFGELDVPGGPGTRHSPPFEYTDPSPRENANQVRVFYVPYTKTVQEFQEIVTMVRTITDTRRVFQHNARRAMIVRGTQGQVALTEQLLDALSHQSSGSLRHTVTDEFRMPDDPREGSVRVFFAEHAASPEDFTGLVTLLRTVTGTRRVFQYNDRKATAVRGTPEQVELTKQLFDELDQAAPPQPQRSPEFLVPGGNEVVRVFYLDPAKPIESFQDAATKIRATAEIRQAYFYGLRRALVVRGNVTQVLQAAQILQDASR